MLNESVPAQTPDGLDIGAGTSQDLSLPSAVRADNPDPWVEPAVVHERHRS